MQNGGVGSQPTKFCLNLAQHKTAEANNHEDKHCSSAGLGRVVMITSTNINHQHAVDISFTLPFLFSNSLVTQ